MKIYRRYFRSPLRFLLVYLFLPLIFIASSALVEILYTGIDEIFPNLLPKYNRITEKEEYLAFSNAMSAASALLAVFLTGFITAVYDNARYEDVVKRTDGLFRIPKELPFYFKRNFPADVLSAALAPAVFVPLTLPSYSEKFLEYFGILLLPHLRIAEVFSAIAAYFLIFASILLGRTLAMPKALSRFRSTWLASFVDS